MPLARMPVSIRMPAGAGLRKTQEPNVTDRPINVADVREFTTWDSSVVTTAAMNLWIDAATDLVEGFVHRSLITQKWRVIYDAVLFDFFSVPDVPRVIELPMSPVQTLDSIKVFDEDDVETAFAVSNVYFDGGSVPARVALRPGNTWPTGLRALHGIEFNYTAGYGDNAADVPDGLRAAVARTVATHLEHREDAVVGKSVAELPLSAQRFAERYRIITL